MLPYSPGHSQGGYREQSQGSARWGRAAPIANTGTVKHCSATELPDTAGRGQGQEGDKMFCLARIKKYFISKPMLWGRVIFRERLKQAESAQGRNLMEKPHVCCSSVRK